MFVGGTGVKALQKVNDINDEVLSMDWKLNLAEVMV